MPENKDKQIEVIDNPDRPIKLTDIEKLKNDITAIFQTKTTTTPETTTTPLTTSEIPKPIIETQTTQTTPTTIKSKSALQKIVEFLGG